MRIDYCCTLPSQCNWWRIRPHWAYCPNLVMRLLVTFQLKSLLKMLWTIKNRVKCPKFFKAAKIKTENKTTKKNQPISGTYLNAYVITKLVSIWGLSKTYIQRCCDQKLLKKKCLGLLHSWTVKVESRTSTY